MFILLKLRARLLYTSSMVAVCAFFGFNAFAYSTPMSCPLQFHTLPLTPSASFCQAFDKELPASLSYFSQLQPEAVKAFYIEALGTPNKNTLTKGRFLLNYPDRQLTLVISADGIGSQIDILLKK